MSTVRVLFASISCYILLACASAHRSHPDRGEVSDGQVQATTGKSSDMLDAPERDPNRAREPVIIPGSGVLVRTPSSAAASIAIPADGEGFQLNFVDTDIATVVGSVIGDALGLPYLIDPQVKGTISLQATHPLARADVLPSLEAALRLQGLAMVAANGGYSIVPLKQATGQIAGLRAPGERRPGYGVEIVPLKFVSVMDMEKILKPFATEGAILRVDESRNILLLAGSAQERATLAGVVQTFDVDWLAGMSFGIYPLEYADPRTLAEELTQVLADPKSPIGNVVRLVPLARLNSLVVVTHQAEYLKKVEAWIRKLDIGVTAPGRRLYVFDVQNGKASDLAESLSRILSLPYEPATRNRGPEGGARGRTPLPREDFAAQESPLPSGSSAGGSGNGMRIVPNEDTNALLILATPDEFALIESALKRLDVEPIQVLIEASLAEVQLTDTLRFGLQWAYQDSTGPIVFSESGAGAIARQFPGFSYLYTGSTSIQAVLNTLESLTNVRVISSPKLLVLNNHEAQLQVGDQVPVVTQSAVSAADDNAPIVNSVELRDTGVILRVTPRVNKNGLVLLDIAQEVSDVVKTTTSAINSPTIQQRKLSSSVVVHDGETIALGGLIRDSRNKSRGGIPLLRRLPVLGTLFGSVSNDETRTELVVLLKPRVIRSRAEATGMMDELREQFRTLRKTLPEWREDPRQHAK